MKIYNRVQLSDAERAQIECVRNKDGKAVDPNTGKVLEKGKIDIGHKYGYEERAMQKCAKRCGMSQKEYNKMMKNPKLYRFEDRHENRSHLHECKNTKEQMHKCMQVIREFKNKDNGKSLLPARERNTLVRAKSQQKSQSSRSDMALKSVSYAGKLGYSGSGRGSASTGSLGGSGKGTSAGGKGDGGGKGK